MTAVFRNPSRCKKCNRPLVCACGAAHTGTTPFSDWIRNEMDDSQNYDVENLDFIRFHYRDGWYVTIEEKQHGAQPSSAQKDTHGIVAQMLQIASGSQVQTMRGRRPIEYRGHYVVSFENTTPSNSAWVKINGMKYELVQSRVQLLLTTGDPRTPEERDLDIWQRESLATRTADHPR